MAKFLCGFLCVFYSSLAFSKRVCPNNDFEACGAVLTKTHKSDKGARFRAVYDDICATNSKFKCTKITVMGDAEQTKKEMAKDRAQAHFFLVQQDDGTYVYVFEKR